MGTLREDSKRQIELLNDETARQLLEDAREAFRLAMKEAKGRNLTPVKFLSPPPSKMDYRYIATACSISALRAASYSLGHLLGVLLVY